jgi:hypothetical protein
LDAPQLKESAFATQLKVTSVAKRVRRIRAWT